MSTPHHCETCGRADSTLIDGMCLPCRAKYLVGRMDAALASIQPSAPKESFHGHPYTRALAIKVHDIVAGYPYGDVTVELVEHVITEALCQASFAIRRGETVELEYFGQFCQDRGLMGKVYWSPDYALERPLPRREEVLS